MAWTRLLMLVFGCCFLLTCQAQDGGVSTVPEPSPAVPGGGSKDDSWAPPARVAAQDRLAVHMTRVDSRVAEMATSLVRGSEHPPVLRLDPLLLGGKGWLRRCLRCCGLTVRQVDGFLLISTPAGGDGGSLRSALRGALPPVHAAAERVQQNLRGRLVTGHRGVEGKLERVLLQSADTGASLGKDGCRIDMSQGAIEHTGRALDLAIDGPGLFMIEVVDRQGSRAMFTRDGSLACQADGTVVSRSFGKAAVLPKILIPPNTAFAAVGMDGRIQGRANAAKDGVSLGRLSLAWFEHPERLRPVAPGLLARTAEAGVLIEACPTEQGLGFLRQGCLEGSNVNEIESWAQWCRLEDARQVLVAMIAELDGEPGVVEGRGASVVTTPSSRQNRARAISTVTLPLAEPPVDAMEPTLPRFLRLRGVDAVAGDREVILSRSARTASVLVDYLRYLRRHLDLTSENIANAAVLERTDGQGGPYRRKMLVLDDAGEAKVVEDMSPWRAVWVGGPQESVASVPSVALPAEQRVTQASARANNASGGWGMDTSMVTDAGDAGGPPLPAKTPVWVGNQQAGDGHNAAGPRLVMYPNVDVDYEMADSEALSREYGAVRDALEAIGPEAVPSLIGLLMDSNRTLHQDAVWALAQIGPDAGPAIPALIAAMSTDDFELRAACAEAMLRIGPDSRVVNETVVAMWTAALSSAKWNERYRAAVALGCMGPRAAGAVPELARLLNDPTSGAGKALGRIGLAAEPAVPALIEALSHREVPVRHQAANALGRIGPAARQAVPALVSAMKHGDTELRWRAAAAIGMIGAADSGCVEALVELLRDQNAYVRDRVAESLGRLGLSTSDAARAVLTESRVADLRQRVWPLFALALIVQQPNSPVAGLAQIAASGEPEVRVSACRALAGLGPLAAPAVATLITAVREGGAPAVAAMDALAAIGPRAAPAVPELCAVLAGQDPLVRRQAAIALGRIGPGAAAAVPALASLLDDPSETVVEAAAEALGRIGPGAAESVPALRTVDGSRNATVRSAVRSALTAIAAFDQEKPAGRPDKRNLLVSGRDDALADSAGESVAP